MESHSRPQLWDPITLQFKALDTIIGGRTVAIAMVAFPEDDVFQGWLREWEQEDLWPVLTDIINDDTIDPEERVLQGNICEITRHFKWPTGGGICTEGKVYII
jgi:hypothetical protein